MKKDSEQNELFNGWRQSKLYYFKLKIKKGVV